MSIVGEFKFFFRTTVRLGEHDLGSDRETYTVEVPVIKVAKYPQYTTKDGHNDLAILYLDRDVDFSGKTTH